MNKSNLKYQVVNDESIYRLLFETATEGLLLVDAQGAILMANQRAEDLFGYTIEEFMQICVEDLVPAQSRGKHEGYRSNYQENPTRRHMGSGMELSAVKKDGTMFPVEISLNHTLAHGERVVMVLITDISMRKQAEVAFAKLNVELEQRVVERTRELKESQRLYSLIARNFPNGTINVFDHELNYVFVEGRELYQLGVTSEQLMGTNYLDRLPPDVVPFIRENLNRVFEGEDLSFEAKVGAMTHELHCVGLEGISGQVHHILVVEHDITKQKQAEEEVRRALSKERELNELKSRFVSMASHEFRTPLSTILTSLSLVQRYLDPADSEKRDKHLSRIRSSVHNLTGILNDFLNFDKLETGHVSTNPVEVNIVGLLSDIQEEMQTIAKPFQVLEVQHVGENKCVVDGAILRNILVNLVSNAIKYSDEGKTIRIDSENSGGKITIKVTDQGIGIPKADIAHMFQRFFRANNATNIQGTGLGLTIVQKYLDLMGGYIYFDSEENVGSTFTIVIPNMIAQ